MSLESATAYFKQYHMEDRILVFQESSATVELAAIAVHTEPERIGKTLSFMVQEHPILILMAGDAKVDNKKYKDQFGVKAKMLTPDEVSTLIGHNVGGVCPFGIHDGVTVYLDISLKRFETVFPACGSDNSAIELSIPEVEKYSNFTSWVDVCKNWDALADSVAV